MNYEELIERITEAICENNRENRYDPHEIGVAVEGMRIATLIGEIVEGGDTVYDESDVTTAVGNLEDYIAEHEDKKPENDMKQHGLFGSRKTLEEAQTYMMDIIQTMPNNDRLPIMTGFYVFWNTLSLNYDVTLKEQKESK